jgi:hypothetical protein
VIDPTTSTRGIDEARGHYLEFHAGADKALNTARGLHPTSLAMSRVVANSTTYSCLSHA